MCHLEALFHRIFQPFLLFEAAKYKIATLQNPKNEEKEIKVENVETDRCIEEEPTVMNNTGYLTYKIYIVKENDTIESIISKYSVSKELLDSYNDLSDIKLGDKIIIPTNVKSS